MADFNLTVNPYQTIDETGASKGYTDNALGGLFKNIGDSFEAGVKTVDSLITTSLDRQARAMVEPLRDAATADVAGYNVHGATSYTDENGFTSATPGNGDTTTAQLPQEAGSAFDRLNLVKQGVKAGRLSDSYYRSQLDVVSKRLRRMYPGYEDQIDDRLQGLTGSIPANKLLADLQAEASASMASGTGNKLQEEYLKNMHDGAFGPNPPPIESFGGDMNKLVSRTAGFYANKSSVESQRANLGLEQTGSEVAKSKATTTMNADLSNITNTAMTNATSPIGTTFTAIRNKVDQLKQQHGDEPWSTSELAQLETLHQQASQALRVQLRQQSLTPYNDKGDTYETNIGVDSVNQNIEQQVAKLDNYYLGITNKDTGFMSHNAAIVDLHTKGDSAVVLQDPTHQRLKTISDLYGPQVAAWYLSQGTNSKVGTSLAQIGRDDGVLGIGTGEYSSVDDAISTLNTKYPNMTKAERSDAGKAIVSQLKANISNPNMPPALKARTIGALYGSGNSNYATKSLEGFTDLSDPATIKAVKAESDTSGRPEVWNAAKTWVMGTGTTLARNFAIQMRNAQVAPYNSISFDPSTHLFAYNFDASRAPRTAKGGSMAVIDDQAARSATNNFNTMVQGMIPTIKEDMKGQPKDQIDGAINTWVKGMTQSYGVGLQVPLFNAANNAVDASGTPVSSETPFGFDQDGKFFLNHARPGSPMRLGGPDTQDGGPGPVIVSKDGGITNVAETPPQPGMAPGAVEARQGILSELKELHGILASTTDPRDQAGIRNEIQHRMDELQSLRTSHGAGIFANPALGGSQGDGTSPLDDRGPNTKSGEPEPGLGDPAVSPLDLLPGKAAITGAVKGMGVVLPFIGKEAASLLERGAVKEGGATITSAAELEAQRAAKGMTVEDRIAGNSTTGSLSSDATQANIEKLQLLGEEGSRVNAVADGIVSTKTPNEIGKRIDQLNEFKKYSTDPSKLASYDKELEPLLLARQKILGNIKSIEGGGQGSGLSTASLRGVDEPVPKGLSADVNPKIDLAGRFATKHGDEGTSVGTKYTPPQLKEPEGAMNEYGVTRYSEQQLAEIRYNQKIYDINLRIKATGNADTRDALLQEKRAILNSRKEWRSKQ